MIEGVPYDVDFYQDFSSIYLNEHPITEIAAAELMEFVQHFYEEPADYYPTAADYQWGQ